MILCYSPYDSLSLVNLLWCLILIQKLTLKILIQLTIYGERKMNYLENTLNYSHKSECDEADLLSSCRVLSYFSQCMVGYSGS